VRRRTARAATGAVAAIGLVAALPVLTAAPAPALTCPVLAVTGHRLDVGIGIDLGIHLAPLLSVDLRIPHCRPLPVPQPPPPTTTPPPPPPPPSPTTTVAPVPKPPPPPPPPTTTRPPAPKPVVRKAPPPPPPVPTTPPVTTVAAAPPPPKPPPPPPPPPPVTTEPIQPPLPKVAAVAVGDTAERTKQRDWGVTVLIILIGGSAAAGRTRPSRGARAGRP
jgi:hypothetical protein